MELRTAGRTYDQIATELGYANRGTVYRMIAEALKAQTVEATQDLRDLERSRLDALQYALWDKAMAGDIKAARAAMNIMARCRMHGLDRVALLPDEPRWPRTVVVPPTN